MPLCTAAEIQEHLLTRIHDLLMTLLSKCKGVNLPLYI